MNWSYSSSEISGLVKKSRNTCSLWLFRLFRASGAATAAAAVSSILPSSSTVVCAHQHAAAGRGRGGLWNFGMFIVDLVRALTNNRCLMQANTNISWHATLLTWICKGLSPLNLQTQIITDFGAGVLPSNTSMQTRESGWLYEINAQKNKWRGGECCGFCFVLL